MSFLPKANIAKFLKLRDELTFSNIRREILPLVLVFPLSVIAGDLRYFDLKIELWSFQSYELMLYPLGLGWLVLAFFPQKQILPLLRTAAVCSVLLLGWYLGSNYNWSLVDDYYTTDYLTRYLINAGVQPVTLYGKMGFKLLATGDMEATGFSDNMGVRLSTNQSSVESWTTSYPYCTFTRNEDGGFNPNNPGGAPTFNEFLELFNQISDTEFDELKGMMEFSGFDFTGYNADRRHWTSDQKEAVYNFLVDSGYFNGGSIIIPQPQQVRQLLRRR